MLVVWSLCLSRLHPYRLAQTANVLASPRVLLEIYMALKNEVPVIPVLLMGRGYHFDEAKVILQDLPTQVRSDNASTLLARALRAVPCKTPGKWPSVLIASRVAARTTSPWRPCATDTAVTPSQRL